MPKKKTCEERNKIRVSTRASYKESDLNKILEWRPRVARSSEVTERQVAAHLGIHHVTFSQRMGFFGKFTSEQINSVEMFLGEKGL